MCYKKRQLTIGIFLKVFSKIDIKMANRITNDSWFIAHLEFPTIFSYPSKTLGTVGIAVVPGLPILKITG